MKIFWDKVNKTSDCWNWTGATNKWKRGLGGYGIIGIDGKNIKSHRFSWELHNGPIPKGKFVLHKCNNRLCVNPDHLYLGTQRNNMMDRVEVPGAKAMNDNEVRIARVMKLIGMTYRQISKLFGPSESAMRYAIIGKGSYGKIV